MVTISDLPADAAFDAVLIFGGDGSVHRQLAAAVASQAPVLCAPAGSGNDFARALGLGKLAQAVEAWKKFCASGGNIRQVDVVEIMLLQPGAAVQTRDGAGGSPG